MMRKAEIAATGIAQTKNVRAAAPDEPMSVRVTGAVTHPGVKTLSAASLVEAITMCDGFSVSANPKKIEVLHHESNGSAKRVVVDVTRILKEEVADIKLERGDEIYVPEELY